jgi:hypothetical protein
MIGSREFQEWRILEEIEPWGDRRLDILFAQLVTLIANVNRDTKRRPDPFSVTDFKLDWDDQWQTIREQYEVDVELDDEEPNEQQVEENAQDLMTKVQALHVWFGGEPS